MIIFVKNAVTKYRKDTVTENAIVLISNLRDNYFLEASSSVLEVERNMRYEHHSDVLGVDSYKNVLRL
jgi:hypothetical protein